MRRREEPVFVAFAFHSANLSSYLLCLHFSSLTSFPCSAARNRTARKEDGRAFTGSHGLHDSFQILHRKSPPGSTSEARLVVQLRTRPGNSSPTPWPLTHS